MAKCETCGNDYAQPFQVTMKGKTHTFDCFACAIQLLAPACGHCGCVILGQGFEHEGDFYCSNHCVRQSVSPSRDEVSEGAGRPPTVADPARA